MAEQQPPEPPIPEQPKPEHPVSEQQAKFRIGEIIEHRLFDYSGVVFDVDPVYGGSEEWYEQVALSRPPKTDPWYHVLVNGAVHTTYVAERNLEHCETPRPIAHPFAEQIFSSFDGQRYHLRHQAH